MDDWPIKFYLRQHFFNKKSHANRVEHKMKKAYEEELQKKEELIKKLGKKAVERLDDQFYMGSDEDGNNGDGVKHVK